MPFKIKPLQGVYGVLGAVLLFASAALGLWFPQAQDGLERSAIGLVILVLAGGVLFTAWKIFHLRHHAASAPATPLGGLAVAPKEATQEQVRHHAADLRPGPGGRYWIRRPPADWLVE